VVPSLLINDILTQWRDQLDNSQAIIGFCQTKYGKSPKIFIGFDPAAPPSESDCPYITIHSGSKTEGLHRKEYRYTVPVEWSVSNSTKTVAGQVTELDGLYECDELGQLVLAELEAASPSHPISYLKYSTLKEETFPQFTGSMEVKISLYPALGNDLTY
jgi:hypothetical protein